MMTETQDKDGMMVKYNDARNQEATSLLRDPAPQGSIRIQDTQANSTDDTLVSAERNVGDSNDSLTLQETGMQDAQAGTTGDSHNLSKDHHGQGFLQFGSGQPFGLGALQGTADSDTQYGDIRRPSEEDVIPNSTGWNFPLDIAERESIGKLPLPTYLGYDVKDNIKLIEFVSEEYKEQIDTAWDMAEGTAPTIAIEFAKKGARFLPPNLQAGALGLLALLDICLAIKDVYDTWDDDVRAYEQKHGCSRELAEQNVGLLKDSLDAFMSFSMTKWTKYVLDSIDISADIAIDIISAVLQEIPESKLKEWGRTIRDWRRENVDP